MQTFMQVLTKKALAAPVGVPEQFTASLDIPESVRNRTIAAHLMEKNFRGRDIPRVVLPEDPKNAQAIRNAQFWRQVAMPWNNRFMYTATDAQRLNNQGMRYMVQQPQLQVPSTSTQFKAFMKAMSALFGNIQG